MSTVDIDEHYLRAGEGTNTLCSCGLGFALSSDAHQHIQYQLANIKATLKAELLDKVENKTFWAGDEPCITKDNLIKIVNEL